MPKLEPDFRYYWDEAMRLQGLVDSMGSISPTYRKVVAEIVLLRLHYLLQNTIISVLVKLICRATYLDGSSPNLLVSARSREATLNAIASHRPRKRRGSLSWSKVAEIKNNVKYFLAPAEHALAVLDAHGVFVDELRRVRNRIAHNDTKARQNYQVVVKRYYGAKLNSVTPGTLLLSPRRRPVLLEQYLVKCRILVRNLVKG